METLTLRKHLKIGDKVRNPADNNETGFIIDKSDINADFTTFLCSEKGTISKKEYRFNFDLHSNIGAIKIEQRKFD